MLLAIYEECVIKDDGECKHCKAKRLQFEPPTFCCYSGEVVLHITPMPQVLLDLYTSDSKESIEFRDCIRAYNSIFSFSSMGAKLDKKVANMKQGIYTFKVQGQVHHYVSSLYPSDHYAKFLQLYFYDTEHEVENRMRHMPDLNKNVIEELIAILSINPYSMFLRRLQSMPSLKDYTISIRKDGRLDQRIYNAPSASQVAAVWIEGNDLEGRYTRDIIVHGHSNKSYKVEPYFGCYDPLQYPLLFPLGQSGWHKNISRNIRKIKAQCIDPILEINITNCYQEFEEILRREKGNK